MDPTPTPSTPKEAQLEGLFAAWVSAGNSRSLTLTASQAGVSPSDLISHAKKFGWQQKLVGILNRARAHNEDALVETIVDLNNRHLKLLRLMGKKAEQFLTAFPIDKPADAIKAAMLSIEGERTILGIGDKTEDVASVLARRLEEAQKTKKLTVTATPAEPEFKFNPKFQVGAPPEDAEPTAPDPNDAER